MTLSLRERAMQALVTSFQTMQVGLPVEDPYTVQFDYVRRNPLDEDSWKKRLTLGVHDTNETVQQQSNCAMRTLSVVLEFRCHLESNPNGSMEVASTVGAEIMCNIQRRIWDNKSLDGVVIDVTEKTNELYIDDYDHRQLSGAIVLSVLYRTASDDPRRTR